MKRMLRTFVAVELNAAVRQRAVELIERLSAAGADVKWVEPENLHLTLKFLGQVTELDIPRVCDAVARGAASVEPFELEVRGAGAFPRPARPKTIWLGSGDGQQAMIGLHGRVEAALAKLGYRKEHRRFVPHLTLGRVRSSGPGVEELGQLLAREAAVPAGRVHVAEVIVFSSELGPHGPTYRPLGRGPLNQSGGQRSTRGRKEERITRRRGDAEGVQPDEEER